MTAVGLRSHLGYVLSEAERAVNRGLSAALSAEGMTVEQWRILQALSDGRGHSMGDLAEAALMPHPTLTKAVDRLVDSALVYRRQDPSDRRRVAVYLSDSGTRLVARLDHAATAHHRAVEAAFGAEQAEELMRSLTGLIEALR
ncbi:MarR family transcriptional regulator [Dactylosporangium sp. NPDC005572]|uniref:MarR family winged helix-turn-helix transcriptional regulator n=1 Tax=Dactylosporangium sp. NPDC005572 TaxID=3156889 RepID=UPI0033B95471